MPINWSRLPGNPKYGELRSTRYKPWYTLCCITLGSLARLGPSLAVKAATGVAKLDTYVVGHSWAALSSEENSRLWDWIG